MNTTNPLVLLSLEGLKKVLTNPQVLYAIKEFSKDSTNEKKKNSLASQIALHSLNYEVPPVDYIQVVVKGGRKGVGKVGVLKMLAQIGDRVEMMSEIMKANEMKYRGNMFARTIENGTIEFERLVKWVSTIEDTYQVFIKELSGISTVSPKEFYQFYADRAYELVPNRSKLNIQNFAASSIHNDIGVHLSKWLRALKDPYRSLTLFMIREVIEVFKITGEDLIHNYNHYDRIRGGLEVLINHYFNGIEPQEDKVKPYIKAWVAVAYESYSGLRDTTGKDDFRAALGFVGGNTRENTNTALERMEQRLRAYRKEVSNDTSTTSNTVIKKPTTKRKLRGSW